MKAKLMIILTIAIFLAVQSGPASADKGSRKHKVSGSYTTSFLRFDFVGAPAGAPIIDVLLMGPFSLTVDDDVRLGIVYFPHLLQFPADPADDGAISGSAVWLFDDGMTCMGDLGGPVGADGFRGRGRFNCSDGSKLELHVDDQEVIPGVSVTALLVGKFKKRKD